MFIWQSRHIYRADSHLQCIELFPYRGYTLRNKKKKRNPATAANLPLIIKMCALKQKGGFFCARLSSALAKQSRRTHKSPRVERQFYCGSNSPALQKHTPRRCSHTAVAQLLGNTLVPTLFNRPI